MVKDTAGLWNILLPVVISHRILTPLTFTRETGPGSETTKGVRDR